MLSRKLKAGGSNKSKGSKQSTHETEESQDDTVSRLLGVTIAAISVTRDLVPIDLVKAILGTVANILTIAQSVIRNKSDFLAIVKKCETIRKVLERATENATEADLQGSLGDALAELNISVNRMNSEAASKAQGFFHRLFSATIDGDQIIKWNNDIDRVLALFNLEVTTGMAIDVKIMKKLFLESNGNAFLYSHGLDINIAKLFNAIGAGCVLHIQLMIADNLDTADIMRRGSFFNNPNSRCQGVGLDK